MAEQQEIEKKDPTPLQETSVRQVEHAVAAVSSTAAA